MTADYLLVFVYVTMHYYLATSIKIGSWNAMITKRLICNGDTPILSEMAFPVIRPKCCGIFLATACH